MKIQNIRQNNLLAFKGEPDFLKVSVNAVRARDKGQSLQPYVNEILPSLKSISTKEKSQAIRLLSSIGSKKEVNEVISFLNKEKDLFLKSEAISFLEKHGSREQRKVVLPFLNSENQQVKSSAIKYFASHGTSRDAKYLTPILLDAKNYHDKYEVLRFFVHNGARKHGKLIKKYLVDPNKNIENLAMRFFEEKGTKIQRQIVAKIKTFNTSAQAVDFFLGHCLRSFK